MKPIRVRITAAFAIAAILWVGQVILAEGADKGAGTSRTSVNTTSTETTDTMGAPCPEGGTVLLGKDGDLAQWMSDRGSAVRIDWPLEGGAVTVDPKATTRNLVTRTNYRDFHLHLEFMTHQDRGGNSGVYIQNRYEVQILNSFGKKPAGPSDCGALYKTRPPDVNASRPAGEWQTFDVVFHAPRWDSAGKKTENARITVRHNGKLIHNDVEIPNKTGSGRPEGPSDGPIKLQGHGSPVKFRNIWIVPLDRV